MSGTVKVYEIAEDLKLDAEIVLQKIQALGIQARNRMSRIDTGLVEQIKSALAKDRQASYVEVEVAPGVRKLKRIEPPPSAKPARPVMVDLSPKVVIAPSLKPAASPSTAVITLAAEEEKTVESTPTTHAADVEQAQGTLPEKAHGSTPEMAPASAGGVEVSAVVEATPASGSDTNEEESRAPRPVAEKTGKRPGKKASASAPAQVVEKSAGASVSTAPAAEALVASEMAPVVSGGGVVSVASAGSVESTETSAVSAVMASPVASVAPTSEVASAGLVESTETSAVTTAAMAPTPELAPAGAVETTEKAADDTVPRASAPEVNSGGPVETTEKSAAPEVSASPATAASTTTPMEATEETSGTAAPKPPTEAAQASTTQASATQASATQASATQASAVQGMAKPPTEASKPAGTPAPRPSQPPQKPNAPKRGIEVWDQATKQVIWMPSDAPAARPSTPTTPTRRREVMPAPPTRTSKPGARPLPGSRPTMRDARDARGAAAQPSTVDPKRRPVIKIEQQISLQELARRMNLKATEVLMKLLHVGGVGKNINSTLDADTATLLASEFGFTVEDVKLDTDAIIKKALPSDTTQDSSPRPPVVTVMGHVDHGKTTLLDAILGTRVAEGEAGGITQEVRAYRVNTAKGPVVFFDTPGHEAFTELRSRGAQATDVAVLVVAADDGVMPTTIEAINHVKAAKVPIVVALNKMDKPDANPDKVIRELMEQGVVPSEYGGDTLVVKVSAKHRQGIDELLETLAFQTDYLGLRANAKKAGVGTVFESKLDKGRGAVARVLVQEGIIHNGDVVLVGSAAGASWGRIRAMFDDRGKAIEKAGPSTPVEILGLSEPPNAGDKIYVCVDARKAQEAAEQIKAAVKKAPGQRTVDLKGLLDGTSEKITVHAVIKADAQGAVEGLKKALTELSTDKVEVKVLHAAVGAITETDVQLAVPAHAVVIGFNVRPAGKAAALAEEQKISMRFYNVIYEAVDDVKLLMVGQLKPTLVEKALGKAEVRQVFNITKVGIIAGCMVLDGLIRRGAQMRLVRDGVQVWEGKIGSVRRVKEDVAEVKQGFECGIGLENTPAIKPGDLIEAYETEEVAARL